VGLALRLRVVVWVSGLLSLLHRAAASGGASLGGPSNFGAGTLTGKMVDALPGAAVTTALGAAFSFVCSTILLHSDVKVSSMMDGLWRGLVPRLWAGATTRCVFVLASEHEQEL
jgi:hypothetical protein